VMAIVLSSSDSATLSSVMICWSTVATTVDMSFRYELFALGASTDWHGTSCWLCLKEGGHSFLPSLCNWGRLWLLLLLCVAA
jgi:hypothetical protein